MTEVLNTGKRERRPRQPRKPRKPRRRNDKTLPTRPKRLFGAPSPDRSPPNPPPKQPTPESSIEIKQLSPASAQEVKTQRINMSATTNFWALDYTSEWDKEVEFCCTNKPTSAKPSLKKSMDYWLNAIGSKIFVRDQAETIMRPLFDRNSEHNDFFLAFRGLIKLMISAAIASGDYALLPTTPMLQNLARASYNFETNMSHIGDVRMKKTTVENINMFCRLALDARDMRVTRVLH